MSTSQQDAREMFWDELDPEQQRERMRSYVKRLMDRVDRLENDVRILGGHTHDVSGNVSVPIQNIDTSPRTSRDYGEYQNKLF